MSLDPLQNRLEKEQAAADALAAQPLNPSFPFKPTAFYPLQFGLQNAAADDEF